MKRLLYTDDAVRQARAVSKKVTTEVHIEGGIINVNLNAWHGDELAETFLVAEGEDTENNTVWAEDMQKTLDDRIKEIKLYERMTKEAEELQTTLHNQMESYSEDLYQALQAVIDEASYLVDEADGKA